MSSLKTTFYGGHREPDSLRHLGDDFQTLAKWIQHKTANPSFKLSDLSQSDQHLLFSSARGEFKLNHSANLVVGVKFIEDKPVDGMDPDLINMFNSPNYTQSITNNQDGYYGQFDYGIARAEQDARDAYALARDQGKNHQTAEEAAKATFEAGVKHYNRNVWPGRCRMKNPVPKRVLPIEYQDGKLSLKPTVQAPNDYTRQSGIYHSRPKESAEQSKPVQPTPSSSPLGWSDSSPVSYQSKTPEDHSRTSSVSQQVTEPAHPLIDLDETDLIDGGAFLPSNLLDELCGAAPAASSTRLTKDSIHQANPTGQLGAGLMQHLQAAARFDGKNNDNFSVPVGDGIWSSIYNAAFPGPQRLRAFEADQQAANQSVHPAETAAVATRPVAPPSANTSLVPQTTQTPPVGNCAHSQIPQFSTPCESSRLVPLKEQMWNGMTCYGVPPDLLKARFRRDQLTPAYWTDRLGKERYLRHLFSDLKYSDAKLQSSRLTGKVARKPVHIIVDLSNIVIGFYNTMKLARGLPLHKRIQKPAFSIKNFDSLLRRDRAAAQRIAASSYSTRSSQAEPRPFHIEDAKALGYETIALQRVPSLLGSSAEQEQGVDEILHLKMVQAVLDLQGRPATMILATGDAANAQYSDGFKSNVERALVAGWNVELYSWGSSIAKAWTEPEFTKLWGSQFRVIVLDKFVEELFDMTIENFELESESSE